MRSAAYITARGPVKATTVRDVLVTILAAAYNPGRSPDLDDRTETEEPQLRMRS
jgi:hypothetical protein